MVPLLGPGTPAPALLPAGPPDSLLLGPGPAGQRGFPPGLTGPMATSTAVSPQTAPGARPGDTGDPATREPGS